MTNKIAKRTGLLITVKLKAKEIYRHKNQVRKMLNPSASAGVSHISKGNVV
jgi:hypothetical protein